MHIVVIPSLDLCKNIVLTLAPEFCVDILATLGLPLAPEFCVDILATLGLYFCSCIVVESALDIWSNTSKTCFGFLNKCSNTSSGFLVMCILATHTQDFCASILTRSAPDFCEYTVTAPALDFCVLS